MNRFWRWFPPCWSTGVLVLGVVLVALGRAIGWIDVAIAAICLPINAYTFYTTRGKR